jgi:hypothetical protein
MIKATETNDKEILSKLLLSSISKEDLGKFGIKEVYIDKENKILYVIRFDPIVHVYQTIDDYSFNEFCKTENKLFYFKNRIERKYQFDTYRMNKVEVSF